MVLNATEEGPYHLPSGNGTLACMTANLPHPSVTAQAGVTHGETKPQRSSTHVIDWSSARLAEHACCCSARPAVIAVIPAAPSRPHETELLLCAHHYRFSQHALDRAGATVLDVGGRPVDADLCGRQRHVSLGPSPLSSNWRPSPAPAGHWSGRQCPLRSAGSFAPPRLATAMASR